MGRQRERRKQRQQQQRQEQRQHRQQQARDGFDRWTIIAGAVVIVLVIAILGYMGVSGAGKPTATAPTATPSTGFKPIDGVGCGTMEYQNYHIHQHITLYDHGNQVPLPAEIGMPGGESQAPCYYWIHVHLNDPAIIHVESPVAKTFHLGNFFDIWKATAQWTSPPGDAYLMALGKAASRGQVTAFVNGKRWRGDYRSIPLVAHAVITIEIGQPVIPPKPFTNWQGQ